MTPLNQVGALLLTDVDVLQNRLELVRAADRSHVDIGRAAITHVDRPDPFQQFPGKRFGNVAHHNRPAG